MCSLNVLIERILDVIENFKKNHKIHKISTNQKKKHVILINDNIMYTFSQINIYYKLSFP